MLLIDTDRKIRHHRLTGDVRIAIADTTAGVWLDPDTGKPIRIGSPERDAAIPAKIKGGRQWPEHGGLYLLSAGLIPGVRLEDGAQLIEETDAQRAALDVTEGAYWASVDDYQRKMTARQTLADGGITPGGDEPQKPADAKAQYLSNADNVVATKPAAPMVEKVSK